MGGSAPCPIPFPPRSSPSTQSPSPGELGATSWCSHLPGGGRREGQPLGNPLPGAPLKMVHTLPGQSHLPLPTRTHPWLRSSWYPSTLSLKAGFGHTVIPPLIGLFGPSSLNSCSHIWAAFGSEDPPNTGNSSLALVESIRPSVHPPVHPSLPLPPPR